MNFDPPPDCPSNGTGQTACTPSREPEIARRRLLQGSLAAAYVALMPLPATATPASMRAAIKGVFGDQPIKPGKVHLKLPQIAENGASVQMAIEVDSPGSDTEFVRSIHVFSEKNPLPDVGRFFFAPGAGRTRLTTRIRLADSQTIMAVATLNDGSLWSGSAQTVVTLAACIDTV